MRPLTTGLNMTAEERITQRIEDRKHNVQAILANNPDLSWLANSLREKFNAKMLYLQAGSVIYGKLELGTPVGMMKIEPRKRKK